MQNTFSVSQLQDYYYSIDSGQYRSELKQARKRYLTRKRTAAAIAKRKEILLAKLASLEAEEDDVKLQDVMEDEIAEAVV